MARWMIKCGYKGGVGKMSSLEYPVDLFMSAFLSVNISGIPSTLDSNSFLANCYMRFKVKYEFICMNIV